MFGKRKSNCSKLGILETIRLRWKARRDVKHNRFQPNAIRLVGDGQEELRHIATTPFAILELKNFVAIQRDYLGTRLHKFRVPNGLGTREHQEETFPTLLRILDAEADTLTIDINTSIRQTQDQLDELYRRQQTHAGRREEHLVQMCINQADGVRERYYSNNISKYQALKQILNEKVRIIEASQKYLESILGRILLRLDYYYSVASEMNPELEHMAFSEEVLNKLVDLSIMPEYDTVLANALRQIEAIDRDLEALDI